MLDTSLSENQKRLVLHSDQDINKVLYDIRQDITATKQENLALKTQMAQEIQALQNNMTQEKQYLKAQNDLMEQKIKALEINMTQEKHLVTQLTQENQELKAQTKQDIQALQTNLTLENHEVREQMTKQNLNLKTEISQLKKGMHLKIP